jgi:Transposase IS66 family
VFPDLTGVVVHDRYQNYNKFPGVIHQLCCQHLLRDLEDAAQSYPGAIWPGQVADALRALIHAANLARQQGLAVVPADAKAEHVKLVRHGVRAGLSAIRRLPGANVEQPPARLPLECLRDREDDVLRFISDLRIPPTSNQAERDVRPAKISRRFPAGCAPSRLPGTGAPFTATFPLPPSTASASSPPCATRSAGIPGCRPSPPAPEIRPQAITPRDESERSALTDLNVNNGKRPGCTCGISGPSAQRSQMGASTAFDVVSLRASPSHLPGPSPTAAAAALVTCPATQKALSLPGKGLDLRKLVAGAGFEPATSGL